MKIVYLLFILLFSLATRNIFCQDIHFSQFYTAPLLLNPANTGNSVGDWRLSNNYRKQWKSINIPFTTISVAFDKKIPYQNDFIGVGLNIVNDKAASTTIESNKVYLSGSYAKKLGYHKLHFGMQLGYVMKSSKLKGMTFPSQFDMSNGYFNPDFQNYDPLTNEEISYFDFNSGVIWSSVFKRMKLDAGAALYHINRPDEAYISEKSKLPIRKVVHFKLRTHLSKRFDLVPQFLFMYHKKANDLIAGTNIEYLLPDNAIKFKSVFVGGFARDGYLRNTDAVFFVVGCNISNFEVGVSYDINISQLKTATSNKGALEISLIFNAPSSILQKTAIPCNLY